MHSKNRVLFFRSKDKKNSDNSLRLLNKHNDIFFCIILVYNLSPLNWGNQKKLFENGVILAHHVS